MKKIVFTQMMCLSLFDAGRENVLLFDSFPEIEIKITSDTNDVIYRCPIELSAFQVKRLKYVTIEFFMMCPTEFSIFKKLLERGVHLHGYYGCDFKRGIVLDHSIEITDEASYLQYKSLLLT
jgi:hypothetical protein